MPRTRNTTLGTSFDKPSLDFSATAQPVSSSPATISSAHAIPLPFDLLYYITDISVSAVRAYQSFRGTPAWHTGKVQKTRLCGLQGTSPQEAAMPVTVHDLAAWKARGERFIMLTAYDALTARVLDEAGVPLLLVGDSLGNNVLGYDSTIPVTMEEAVIFTAAVARGASNPMIVGDLPFGSYQASAKEAMRNAP